VAVEDVKSANGHTLVKYKRKTIQVIPASIAEEAKQVMTGPVTHGTATAAQLPGEVVYGKTGTTENYGDAWFVGFDSHYTVAVWVGYPDKLIPMKTQFRGGPVEGGTYPAEIWHDFMVQALNILNQRNPEKNKLTPSTGTTTPSSTVTPSTTAPTTGGTGGATTTPQAPAQQQQPQTKQQPQQQQTPQQQTPAPPAQQTPSTGTGGGTGGATPTG
jgi:penicillin-binding protein 1A